MLGTGLEKSMPLKNRNLGIPGGFDWVEPATGWTHRSDSFNETRDAIKIHRMANPQHGLSLNTSRIEHDMEARYESKLRSIPGGDQWLVITEPSASPPVFSTPRSRSVPAAGVKIANAKAGIGAIKDWLGDGLSSVDQSVAETRAFVCVACPLNQEGDFWQRMEGVAAQGIKLLVEAKNEMKMTTSHDAQLRSCMACDCWNATKVWVPLPHILNNTKPDTYAKLHPSCWIKTENETDK